MYQRRISTRPSVFRLRSLAAVALCSSLLVACAKEEEAKEADAQAAAPQPQIKGQLPPPPDFDEGKAPEKWEDGSYSLYGLRADLDENVKAGEQGTEVLVRGYVQEIYVAPECPSGEVCAPPKQPHVWITDAPEEKGKKRAMMVVNYRFAIPAWDAKRWKKEPEV